MKKVRLLLADNYEAILNSYAKLLERAGYHVVSANSYEDAQRELETHYFHVAILDRRLRDDHDETDNSGIDLAKQSDPAIAKIILTQFPTFESARDALGTGSAGERIAISYASKKEPPSVLLEYVERAVQSLGIPNNLEIRWKAVDRKSLLGSLLPQVSEPELLEERSDELEDLITRLFPLATELEFERLLWQDDERTAILSRAVFSGGVVKYSVLVVGLRAPVSDEAKRFQHIGSDSSWQGVPLLGGSCDSIRFAANLYIFGSLDLFHSRPLIDVFHNSAEKQFTTAMQYLLTQTLPSWYRATLPDQGIIGVAYDSHMDLQISDDTFMGAAQAIQDHIAGLGMTIAMKNAMLHVWLQGREYLFPDPGPVLLDNIGKHTPLCMLPGIIDGQNILVDKHDHAGLTNFRGTGKGPLLAPFVELEAAMRFDWNEEQDLTLRHQTDHLLTQENFSRFQVNDADPSIRKTLKAVLLVRKEAELLLNDRRAEWWIGLLYAIGSRLARRNRNTRIGALQLVRQAHLILAAGLIAQMLREDKLSAGPARQRGFKIDDVNQGVIIDGHSIDLTSQNFRLLQCLYRHRERVCTPDFLVREALGDNYYDPNDRSQRDRLAMAILRLRERIERSPKDPRFVRSENGGYRLYVNPES